MTTPRPLLAAALLVGMAAISLPTASAAGPNNSSDAGAHDLAAAVRNVEMAQLRLRKYVRLDYPLERRRLEAYEAERSMRGEQHRFTRRCARTLADLYERWGKPEEAQKWRRD